jgi:DNA-binding SARP family transcriptional activator
MRTVGSDPLAEHAQRRLMRLNYLRGEHAVAITAFERFEQRLKHELGTRLSSGTSELMAMAKHSDVAAADKWFPIVSARPAPSLRGEYARAGANATRTLSAFCRCCRPISGMSTSPIRSGT